MELIDREVYRREMEKSIELMQRAGDSQNDIACGMRRALRLLEMQDVVDAKEEKHGEWKTALDEAEYEYGTCSECGFVEWDAFPAGRVPNYCQNCGAKMDGKELGK